MKAAASSRELIEIAEAALNPVTVDGRLFGDVAAALVGATGSIYTGVCLDTPGWGLCAERSAAAAMVTAGEFRISRVVAVWRDWRIANGPLHVLPPCGLCRDFMRQIDPGNLDAEVVLGWDDVVSLRELLPRHDWPAPLTKER